MRFPSLNPNRLFGRLDIRTKLAIAFVGLSAASILLVGWYAAEQHLRTLAEDATNDQQRSLAAVRERVAVLINDVTQDLELIAGLHVLDALLDDPDPSALDDTGVSHRDAELFLRDFVAARPHIYRLRVIGMDGVEQAHTVEVEGVAVTLTPGRWRQTGFRYYNALIDGSTPGEIAFAPVELRAEHTGSGETGNREPDTDNVLFTGSRTEASLIPALSFVKPISRIDGTLRGLLVTDVYARSLFQLLASTRPDPGESIVLVGPGGEFLFHSDRREDWNTLLADPERNNLHQELPGQVADQILGGDSGVVTEGYDAVFTFTPLLEGHSSPLSQYTLISSRPAELVYAPVREMRRSITFAGALIVLAAGLLALVAAHQFAAPIRALTEGARQLARGRFDATLEIETNDEIEDLARSFNSMAEALQAREQEITAQGEQLRRYADRLEAMVEERTRELRQSQVQMVRQEKMVAVGQLAAGLAHELGTPLATILCHVQMAQEELEDLDPADSERGRLTAVDEGLDLVVSQVNRCSDIVRKLLDFSRPSPHERTILAAEEVVDVAISLLRHDLHSRGVEIEVGAISPDAQVIGDRNELEQVFVNLIRNGADAMPDGGVVSLTVAVTRGEVRCTVSDQGHGIDEATQRRVFEPFFTTKAPGVGTGLGLWVVHNTVVDHGGRVDIASAPGEGTTIMVTLPAASADPDTR